MQANRKIHLARKKHPFTSYPAAKHPKQQICHQWTFFYCATPLSTLAPAIILLTLVPLQKFPFLVSL